MIRSIFVFLHRWIGLLMTAFLVLVGLTGSLLAFNHELDRFFAPQLYATPRPGVPKLDLATLAEKAAPLAPPNSQFFGVQMHGPDSVRANFLPPLNPKTGKFEPVIDPKTGKPDMEKTFALVPPEVFVDPWTGAELGRRGRIPNLSEGLVELMPFIFHLHYTLQPLVPSALPIGTLLLGIIAVAWTIDCFVGFYLTLPPSPAGFWRKWRTAWAIKRGAGAYRLNFDLHRASGLWLWPMLLVFAWSSVAYNMGSVYKWVMPKLFEFGSTAEARAVLAQRPPIPRPSLDWRGAQTVGERLIVEQAEKRGFAIGDPVSLLYNERNGVYIYAVRSNLAVSSNGYGSRVSFDGDTGELVGFEAPTGAHTGDTVTTWLKALHTASVFGLPYKIFVCALGLVITMLSVTGVYIWWKKRKARRFRKAQGASSGAPLDATTAE